MSKKVDTIEYLKTILKKEKFKKKRNTWYKETENVFNVIELQKSCWSDKYYLNVGVEYKNINNTFWDNKNINIMNASTNARFGCYVYYPELSNDQLCKNAVNFFNKNTENLSSLNTEEYIDSIVKLLLKFFHEYRSPDLFKIKYESLPNSLKGNIGIYPALREYCKIQ